MAAPAAAQLQLSSGPRSGSPALQSEAAQNAEGYGLVIISASRRTDIPAFYSEWFMNRIRGGYCAVPNPYNRNQVSWVSLKPKDVDVIVFWTRNPKPLMSHLDELDQLGYRYYFQYTVLDNPNVIDPKSPPLASALKTFRQLSDRVGAERVIWRYDPIVFSPVSGPQYHALKHRQVAAALQGYTRRCVISIVDIYAKASKRLASLKAQGFEIEDCGGEIGGPVTALIVELVETAKAYQMEVFSCSETLNLQALGVTPGKCVDDAYIAKIFGVEVGEKKDASQRKACGCVVSKDIGMYDSCLFGCQYCYATQSFERARINHAEHNPLSAALIGEYDAAPPRKNVDQPRLLGDE